MKIESIEILSYLEEITDIFDVNTDVSINLENGQNYIVVVGTPKNLLTLMANEKSEFLLPGDPIIVVQKMTKEIIEKVIYAYAAENDGYYLKFYSAELDNKTLDVLKKRSIARSKFIQDLLEKGKSIDNIENYDLINFNLNNL